MFKKLPFRSVLIHFLAPAAVMFCAAGCPSGADQAGPPPATNEESTEPPAAQEQVPGTVPGRLVEESEVDASDGPPSVPLGSEPDEMTPPASGEPEELSNPLRNPDASTTRDPTTTKIEGHATEPPADTHQRQREPFDPIKVNGPIFVGWPKPKLALVVTGRQDGYIEPCGCAGLDRMKGGMSRRYSFFEQLRKERGWPVVAIDVGGLAKGYGRQAELKFHIMAEGMRKMGYDAIALGKSDLQLPAGELVAETAAVQRRPSPFLSANVGLFGFDAKLTAQTRIVEAAGMRIGIAAVLGKQFQKEIHSEEIDTVDPETALSRVTGELKQKSDLLILLAHASMEESRALARKFPDYDLVVTAGGAPEPPGRPTPIEGTKALLIEVGQKGMDAIVLGIFDDPKQPFRYQSVPLDSRFPASSQMQKLMEIYQEQLKQLGFAGLGLRAVPHPQSELGGKFVGSKECETCHEESYIVWRKSGHSKAYSTLTGLDPPRNFDPECVSCHVVGWHPTQYFPYETGYQGPETTPQLTGTGCETCHGPGEAHVDAENGSDLELQEKLRKAVAISKEEAQDPRSGKLHCYTCHDLDNSPEFDFDTYWPKVEHNEYEDD